jgi:hypothetical protein
MNSSHAERQSLMIGRIAGGPLVGELLKAHRGHLGVDRGVNRAQIPRQLVPVLALDVAEGVADQVQDAGLHLRERPCGRDRLWQALEPIAHHQAHVFHTPFLISVSTASQNFAEAHMFARTCAR